MRILVIDDDSLSLELVNFVLRNAGYDVETSDNPRGAIHLIERQLPDLLLLDVKMPDMDGFSFSEHLREQGYAIPCIFLTACGDMEDRLRGFALQAEDYICKPYHPQELIARVAVAARHQGENIDTPLCAGSFKLLPEALQVVIHGTTPIDLTPTEMQIFLLLIKHVGHVVTRETFFAQVWQYETSNVLDVFIRRLRAKLGNLGESIVCVRGVGYSLHV